jgi:hypothetical protein
LGNALCAMIEKRDTDLATADENLRKSRPRSSYHLSIPPDMNVDAAYCVARERVPIAYRVQLTDRVNSIFPVQLFNLQNYLCHVLLTYKFHFAYYSLSAYA